MSACRDLSDRDVRHVVVASKHGFTGRDRFDQPARALPPQGGTRAKLERRRRVHAALTKVRASMGARRSQTSCPRQRAAKTTILGLAVVAAARALRSSSPSVVPVAGQAATTPSTAE